MQYTINSAIQNFYKKNWTKRDFLTEDDVRCHLFKELEEKLRGYCDVSVHSEVRWYGNSGTQETKRLKYRSDIVIIDSNDLQVDNLIFELPSKGYSFDRYYSIIEIKLRRPNNKDSDFKYDEVVKKDIEKLREIQFKTTGGGIQNKSYYFIAFDKKRDRKILKNINNEENTLDWKDWVAE